MMESLLLVLTLVLCGYFDIRFVVLSPYGTSLSSPSSLSSSSSSGVPPPVPQGSASQLLVGISAIANQYQPSSECRVAIGYNSNLDVIADALPLFNELPVPPPFPSPDGNDIKHGIDHSSIDTSSSLGESFLYHFKTGSAAERFITDKTLFEKIVSTSLQQSRAVEATGGNAALMANKLSSMGCKVLLGGPVGKRLLGLLNNDIQLASPLVENDEVHLILEYKANNLWAGVISPRANRYILTSDDTNSGLLGAGAFHYAVSSFNPQLIIVSGFHLLEGRDSTYRISRLNEITMELGVSVSSLSSRPRLHVELASMTDITFVKHILDIMLPRVDSLGLNEQELGASYRALGGTRLTSTQLSSKIPDVEAVIEVLTLIMNTYANEGGLTRIHFHSLAFHVIATRRGSSWKDSQSAVAMGSFTATVQACDALDYPQSLTDQHVDHLLAWTYNRPVQVWSNGDIDFAMAPVVVCKNPTKTVGLGDAISATGLLYHL